jgi:hypothetical protein
MTKGTMLWYDGATGEGRVGASGHEYPADRRDAEPRARVPVLPCTSTFEGSTASRPPSTSSSEPAREPAGGSTASETRRVPDDQRRRAVRR